MAIKGTCEDGCGASSVWVQVRSNWQLLCDNCANAAGVLFVDRRGA